jgi:hypothetical protein
VLLANVKVSPSNGYHHGSTWLIDRLRASSRLWTDMRETLDRLGVNQWTGFGEIRTGDSPHPALHVTKVNNMTPNMTRSEAMTSSELN